MRVGRSSRLEVIADLKYGPCRLGKQEAYELDSTIYEFFWRIGGFGICLSSNSDIRANWDERHIVSSSQSISWLEEIDK